MKNSNFIISIIVSMLTFSCFSAKGLPIKETKADTTLNNDSSQKTKDLVDVQTDYITLNPIIDHAPWDKLLKKHVAKNGNVDYKGFKNDSQKLNEYVHYLASQVPSESWSKDEQLAYFINVYNANTIKLIIDNYPTKSIKDIKNPWGKNRLKIGDKDYSLADIENGILRKMNEPRIHFAINCASFSCPKLLNTAYTSDNVQELMERATKEFINNSDKNELSEDNPKLSEIFKWYKGDFKDNGSVIDYINNYADIKISKDAKINYIDYNWSLNAQN